MQFEQLDPNDPNVRQVVNGIYEEVLFINATTRLGVVTPNVPLGTLSQDPSAEIHGTLTIPFGSDKKAIPFRAFIDSEAEVSKDDNDILTVRFVCEIPHSAAWGNRQICGVRIYPAGIEALKDPLAISPEQAIKLENDKVLASLIVLATDEPGFEVFILKSKNQEAFENLNTQWILETAIEPT